MANIYNPLCQVLSKMRVLSFKVEKGVAEEARGIVERQRTSLSSEIRKELEKIIREGVQFDSSIKGDKLVIITIKLPEDLYQEMISFIAKKGISQSEVLRGALNLFIQKNKPENVSIQQ
ncbi:ribbon-helix-helix domain-containing protein [Metallosphaera hakonensis]|nr:ribbon-helix-helix domain-containing protein [Metallosphaera hakonensis]